MRFVLAALLIFLPIVGYTLEELSDNQLSQVYAQDFVQDLTSLKEQNATFDEYLNVLIENLLASKQIFEYDLTIGIPHYVGSPEPIFQSDGSVIVPMPVSIDYIRLENFRVSGSPVEKSIGDIEFSNIQIAPGSYMKVQVLP